MAEINDSLFENFFELWDNMIRNGVFQFVFVAFTLYIKVHFIFYVMHTFAKLLVVHIFKTMQKKTTYEYLPLS